MPFEVRAEGDLFNTDQKIVAFLEIIMLLYQVSMQIELRKKLFRTMLAFTP